MDGIALDGLTDPFKGISMGDCAEKTVTDFGFDRESQDSYALTSYKRSIESISSGRFSNQIVPVEGVNADEEHTRFNEAKFRLLKPAFIKNTGTITAGNASKLNDGACAVSTSYVTKYWLRNNSCHSSNCLHWQGSWAVPTPRSNL